MEPAAGITFSVAPPPQLAPFAGRATLATVYTSCAVGTCSHQRRAPQPEAITNTGGAHKAQAEPLLGQVCSGRRSTGHTGQAMGWLVATASVALGRAAGHSRWRTRITCAEVCLQGCVRALEGLPGIGLHKGYDGQQPREARGRGLSSRLPKRMGAHITVHFASNVAHVPPCQVALQDGAAQVAVMAAQPWSMHGCSRLCRGASSRPGTQRPGCWSRATAGATHTQVPSVLPTGLPPVPLVRRLAGRQGQGPAGQKRTSCALPRGVPAGACGCGGPPGAAPAGRAGAGRARQAWGSWALRSWGAARLPDRLVGSQGELLAKLAGKASSAGKGAAWGLGRAQAGQRRSRAAQVQPELLQGCRDHVGVRAQVARSCCQGRLDRRRRRRRQLWQQRQCRWQLWEQRHGRRQRHRGGSLRMAGPSAV